MTKRIALIALAFLVGSLTSCILDPKNKDDAPPPDKPVVYKPLTSPENVIFNLEQAYNERNVNEYDKLLAEQAVFTFFFAEADVNDPINPTGEQWGRLEELTATGNMFDPNYQGENRITSISLKLFQSNVTWLDHQDPDFPAETWRKVQINYEYTIQADPDWTWITGVDAKAEFICREEPTGSGQWRLCRWRDLGFAQ